MAYFFGMHVINSRK